MAATASEEGQSWHSMTRHKRGPQSIGSKHYPMMVPSITVATPLSSPILSPLQFREAPPISPNNTSIFCDDERPFHCTQPGCHQQFKRKFTLAEHLKTHTGERPFLCPVHTCGKTFATSGNLARHKRLHPWLKPQVCLIDGCGRAFSNEVKLERHLKSHFKGPRVVLLCEVEGCDKSFSTMGNLTRHMKHQHRNYTRVKENLGHGHELGTHSGEVARLLGTPMDPASKPFSPLKHGVVSSVSDEELCEFLAELF